MKENNSHIEPLQPGRIHLKDTLQTRILLYNRFKTDLIWIHYGGKWMPIHLSIKNAPDDIVRRLKERAERHHRSLQGELLSILEEAVSQDTVLTPEEVLRRVSDLRLSTPSEASKMIRADRDAR